MNKVKKLFNSFILTFVLVGAFFCGISFYGIGSKSNSLQENISADETYQEIENSLPDYFRPTVENGTAGNDGNSLFLLANNGKIKTQFSNGTKDGLLYNQGLPDEYLERNYAFYPNLENQDTFYYFNFDFETSLSLYHNITNSDIAGGSTVGLTNLLEGRDLGNFAKTYSKSPDTYITQEENGPEQTNSVKEAKGFLIDGYAFVPRNFKIDFSLDTTRSEVGFGTGDNSHEVILAEQGTYTLLVPFTYYLTEDGGKTFTDMKNTTIAFSFMVFNSTTYLDSTTNLPNTTSTLFQESSLINNAAYSRYYFYNYSSTQLDDKEQAQLPTYTYDPSLYELTIEYINIDDEQQTVVLKYENEELVAYDRNNRVVSSPVLSQIKKIQDKNMAVLSFNDLGTYNISFDFIYKPEGSNKTFNLSLSTLNQRVYMFGYQALYTSQDRDPVTNQTLSKELKAINDDKTTYAKSADITSISGSTISQKQSNVENMTADMIKNSATNLATIKPISTNQTPIKLRKNSNVTLNTSHSKIYKVTLNDNGLLETIDDGTIYSGDNLKDAGTYLVVAIYQFNDFLSTTGTLQSSYYHYQIFYLTITNTTPTVTVEDTAGKTLYTDGYTNKGVYVIDNSTSGDYDANVEILLTARNYNASNTSYYFQDVNFLAFAGADYPGITYYENLGGKYEGKAGLYIENTAASIYHNAEFTVSIKSANSSQPSTRKFTIDTNEIGDITAKSVSFVSNSNYSIGSSIQGNLTNQPMIFSWKEKSSGATTYGYLKFYELKQTQYYDNSGETFSNSSLLKTILEGNGITPVNSYLDLSEDAGWSNYSNTNTYNNSATIPSSYVRSSAGLYIFEVYDEAGNSTFDIFLLDNTSPTFIKRIYTIDDGNYELYAMNGSETVTVSPDYLLSILWGDKKGVYIKGFTSPYDVENAPTHLFNSYVNDGLGFNVNSETNPLKTTVNKFLNEYTSKIDNVQSTSTPPDESALTSYNGRYITVDIQDTAWIQQIKGGYQEYTGYYENDVLIPNVYQIDFFKENGEPNEGAYKFLLRDDSNTKGPHSEQNYKTAPSAFLTVTVTSDSSRLEFILNGDSTSPVSPSGYDLTGKFYKSNNEEVKNNPTGNLETSDKSYKYTYYSPIRTTLPLSLSFIPYANNGSLIEELTLTYYAYEKKSEVRTMTAHNGSKYSAQVYYYTFSETPTRKIDITPKSTLVQGQTQFYEIAFGTNDGSAAPGKYVITRKYSTADNTTIDRYDYYERTLTLIVDRYNIISSLEDVDNNKLLVDDKGKQSATSLESIVGGDINISMYSEQGLSNIALSFVDYNTSTGLSEGSLYTSTNMVEGTTPSISLESNKLPLAVKIPKYKYTLYSEYDSAINSYKTNINDRNSFFGDFAKIEVAEGNKTEWRVYTNLIYKAMTTTNEDGSISEEKDKYGDSIFEIDTENSLFVDSFENESDADRFIETLKNDASIMEYELYVKIEYRDNNGNPSIWYRSNGTTTDNYLNFYLAPGETEDLPANPQLVSSFNRPGKYYVTMYQANNQSALTEGNAAFNSLYKFAFEIKSEIPDFQVLTTSGTELDSDSINGDYYTNNKTVKVRWTDSTSEYMAKIEKSSITVTPYRYGVPGAAEKIAIDNIHQLEGSQTFEFSYDLSDIWHNGDHIEVSMQFEGLDSTRVSKSVYVDYSAPLDTVGSLMDATATATNNTFDRLYQERNMRVLYDYAGNEKRLSNSTNLAYDLEEVSYSYSSGSGNFRYYSYTVDRDFFEKTYQTLTANANNPANAQEIYIKAIDTATTGAILSQYTQVTKESFSKLDQTYFGLKKDYANLSENLINNTYYEMVELDTAGNMAVYIVYLKDTTNDNLAISYTNTVMQEDGKEDRQIANSQIQNGFNIYSNSGFALTSLDYNQDVWGFYTTSINGVTRYFMRSPWLTQEGQIYELVGSSTSMVNLQAINVNEIFADVRSSQNKHTMLVSDRMNGDSKQIYVSIMDANLTTAKYSDSSSTTLQIVVPSAEQIESINPPRAYVYPIMMTIYRWNEENWVADILAPARDLLTDEEIPQVPNGNPQSWSAFNNDFLTLNYVNGRLEINIRVQNNSSTKFKFEITDNFGNVTTVVQLINEETCQEVVGNAAIYENIESDNSITYLSAGNLTYQFNNLLYVARVTEAYVNGNPVIDNPTATRKNGSESIYTYTLSSLGQSNYNKVYVIEVYERENYREGSSENVSIRTVNLHIYNKLPVHTLVRGGEEGQNNIWFLDKNNLSIGDAGVGTVENIPSLSVTFRDKTITTNAKSITTFSNNVTVGFDDGQNISSTTDPSYFKEYRYSVYISNDAQNWTNINDEHSGYTISGAGSYYILAVYDDENLFAGSCQLYMVNILNSSSISYYFHVDGLPVEPRKDFKYTVKDTGDEISTVYVLSVNYAEKDARVVIEENKELNTNITWRLDSRSSLPVEIYTYSSDITKDSQFAVVYIGESTQILRNLSYENANGSSVPLLQSSDPANPRPIVALAEESAFNRLKITWNNYHEIPENDINVEVLKYFEGVDGNYAKVNATVYTSGENNYIYLTRAGSYRLRFYDSCEDPNIHLFGRSQYINITFLNNVPYTISYTDPTTQEEVVSEPINRAIYNGTVKLSLTNPSDYFASGYPIISVLKDGQPYTGFTTQGTSNFIFNETGYYSVSFEAVSTNQESVRQENFTFSIINANESRLSLEYSTYSTYYIKSIIKDGVDVTRKFVKLIDDAKITVGDLQYLTNLQVSYFDEKTGSGRYIITIETGEQTYANTTATSFTFAFRINLALPPISVDLEEGGSTSNTINVTFNIKTLYDMIGDCIVSVPGYSPLIVNAETVERAEQELVSTDISVIGTNYVQVYSMSGNLLYSFKVTRTEPLNTWAIIAIVIGVIIVGVVIFITIKLRKRLKVK